MPGARQYIQVRDDNPEGDTIGAASTDEMFAFSQIAAAGANPSSVIESLEKENSKPKPKPKDILNDD